MDGFVAAKLDDFEHGTVTIKVSGVATSVAARTAMIGATPTVIQPSSPAIYYGDFISGSDSNNGISKDLPW